VADATTKDIVSWTLTAIGLTVTLGWNLHNRIRTDRIAKQLRCEAFEFDEWKVQRTEILRVLREFENAGGGLSVLAIGGHQADALVELVNQEGEELVRIHISLLRELDRVCSEQNWALLAYGQSVDEESDWDRLNSILAAIGEIDEDAQSKRVRLTGVDQHIRAISAAINSEIRVRTAEHSPHKI
jgi:hypothetical protein